MSCNLYVHNDPIGGTKNISGTTCSGIVQQYYLTYGQSACMDDSFPLINLNGLVISGSCLPVTPTPSPTPPDYCVFTGFTYFTKPFQCPNDGLDYNDVYGRWLLQVGSRTYDIPTQHIPITFVMSNGTDVQNVTIPSGQTFTDFIYPRTNFVYTSTGCTSTTYPDYFIQSIVGNYSDCPSTPTPTQSQTQTQTPTVTNTSTVTSTSTVTPTRTPTQTPYPVCPEELVVTDSSSIFLDNGTYSRQYVSSGSSFFYGYAHQDNANNGYIILGTAPDGFNYPIYQFNDGGDINTIYWCGSGILTGSWRAMEQTQNILSSGSTWIGSSTILDGTSITVGSIKYPSTGQKPAGYISYPPICPTTTPTPSITASPTVTPTITPTNTVTPTITPTITSTPTNTQTNTSTVTPTNTPTKTSTPTPTRSYYPLQLNYVGEVTECISCYNGYVSQITVYLPATGDTYPDVGSIVYSNSSLTTPFDGDGRWWYGNITGGYSYLIQNTTGKVLSIYDCNSCPTQTPTQTITPTQTPTISLTPSITPSLSVSVTPTNTPTNTKTPTNTPTQTITPTTTTTLTSTPSVTPTNTITNTNTPTKTATNTPTPSVTPFNPSSLSADIWVDFSDSSSMTIRTSGGNSFIERINNKGTDVSLTAYTQTNAGNQPQVKVSTVFTGVTISAATVSNDWLSGVATVSGFSWTIVYVIGRKLGDGTPGIQPSRFTWGTNSFTPYWLDNLSNTVVRNFSGTSVSYTVTNPKPITYTGQTYLQYISTTGATATRYIEMNTSGLTVTQVGYHRNTFPAATSWLLNEDGTVATRNGEVGEIIMLRRELTSTEKTNLYDYLRIKWGLTY